MSNLKQSISKRLQFLLIFLLLASMYNAYAQPGTLDSTYGNNGTVLTTIQMGALTAYSSALDAQERLIVAGMVWTGVNGGEGHDVLARYKTDGSLDATFGNNGFAIDDLVTTEIFGVTVAMDGKILACGTNTTTTGQYSYDYMILRYNEDGTLDNTFGNNGRVFVDFGIEHRNVAYDIHEQSDGKIIVNGNFQYSIGNSNPLYKIGVCRFLPNGSLDNTFGSNGINSTDANVISVDGFYSKIDSNGKLVISGYREIDNSGYSQAFLLRFNTDGLLDPTFGNAGVAPLDVPLLDSGFRSVVIANDGSLYACGTSTDSSQNSDWNFLIAKFLPSGALDTSYAINGYLSLDFFGLENNDQAHNLSLQQDGKLLVVGQVKNENFIYEFGALRLNVDGSLDNTFGENGIFHFTIGPADAYPDSVQLQADGKALLAGYADGDNGTLAFVIARIITDSNVGIVDFDTNKGQVLLYPNPVIETATLQYELTKPATVSAVLLSIEDKTIKQLINNTLLNSGNHKIEVNLSNLASGTYLLKLTANTSVTTVKLIKP